MNRQEHRAAIKMLAGLALVAAAFAISVLCNGLPWELASGALLGYGATLFVPAWWTLYARVFTRTKDGGTP